MMKKIIQLLFLVVLSLFFNGCNSRKIAPPSVLHADTYTSLTSSEQKTLPEIDSIFTLEDAINVGLANSPDYERQKLSLKLAYNDFYKSLFMYLPTVSAGMGGVGFQHINNFNNGYSPANTAQFSTGNPGISLTSNFVLFDGFSRELSLLGDYEKIKANEDAIKSARIMLINQISNIYYSIVIGIESIIINEKNLVFQRNMYEAVKEEYKNNLVTYDNVLNFEFQIKQAEMSVLGSTLNLKLQKNVLASLLGLTTGELPDNIKFESINILVERIDRAFAPLGVEYYLDLAIDQRPDLKGKRALLQKAKYELYSAWGKFAPTITANYNWGLTTSDWRYTGQYINYGISAQWDVIQSGFTRIFDVRKRQIELDISKVDVLESWINAVKEVRDSYTSLMISLQEKMIAQRAIEIAKRQRDIVQEKFENQLESITRLNSVQSDLLSSQLEYISTILNVYKAHSNLNAACGIQTY